jgi:hypothetical protein
MRRSAAKVREKNDAVGDGKAKEAPRKQGFQNIS